MLHAEDAGAGDGRAWDRSGRWLAALAGLALAVSWAQALLSACRWDRVDSSTGAYAAIAADMQHGIWYAPLLADDALGGTRYMPLFPWLTSLVANATPTVIDAGLLVAFVSAVGAALCVGWLAWRHTGSRTVGVLATALVTASQVWRDVAAAGRSDATAVLLNLLGLAVLGAGRARQVLLAGLCFGLATLTKFTDVWGSQQ